MTPSYQRLKLKAVGMEQELFDNDDTLKELKKPKCFTAVQKPWKTTDPSSSF